MPWKQLSEDIGMTNIRDRKSVMDVMWQWAFLLWPTHTQDGCWADSYKWSLTVQKSKKNARNLHVFIASPVARCQLLCPITPWYSQSAATDNIVIAPVNSTWLRWRDGCRFKLTKPRTIILVKAPLPSFPRVLNCTVITSAPVSSYMLSLL